MPATPRPAPKVSRRPRPGSPSTEPRPRTKPAEVRREELLDAAERLFLKQGLAATSVDEIVSAAQVAKGTFYLHFASKEQLLVGLQQRFVSSFCEAIEKALARRRADDFRGRLRSWVQASMTAYLERVALHDLVFHDYHPADRAAMHEDNPVLDNLTALLAQGSTAGVFDVADPKLTAVMLFHALHGAADLAVARGAARKSIVRTLETLFLRAVAAT